MIQYSHASSHSKGKVLTDLSMPFHSIQSDVPKNNSCDEDAYKNVLNMDNVAIIGVIKLPNRVRGVHLVVQMVVR